MSEHEHDDEVVWSAWTLSGEQIVSRWTTLNFFGRYRSAEHAVEEAVKWYFDSPDPWNDEFGPDEAIATLIVEIHKPERFAGKHRVTIERTISVDVQPRMRDDD